MRVWPHTPSFKGPQQYSIGSRVLNEIHICSRSTGEPDRLPLKVVWGSPDLTKRHCVLLARFAKVATSRNVRVTQLAVETKLAA